MSEATYIKCDGCGSQYPEPPDEMPHRLRDGWGIVTTYIKQYDYCPKCMKKMRAALGNCLAGDLISPTTLSRR